MIEATPATAIFNEDVYSLIPNNAKKIIEIGTGSGALARQVMLNNPNVNYVGVEFFDEYYKMSSKICSKMYLENMESASGELLREFSDADVIIFADVLEHFQNPWKVLKRITKWAKNDTLLIASIPNIQHWSVQLSILGGNFNYQESGLLDKTHLRFFTRKSIINMFESTGYKIKGIKPRIFDFPNQSEYLNQIKKYAEACNYDADEAIIDAAAFQYIIVTSTGNQENEKNC
jgi:2-polyprenyl-3-methyl-5-hydroxy-6-metoxy-1,4-benzoquinol methylase